MNFRKLLFQSKVKLRKLRSKSWLSLSQDFYIFALGIIIVALFSSGLLTWKIYENQQTSIRDRVSLEAKLIDNGFSDFLLHVKRIAEDKGRKIAIRGTSDLDNIYYLLRRQFSVSSFDDKRAIKSFKWPHFSWITPDKLIKVKSNAGVLIHPIKLNDADYLYQSSKVPWQLHLSKPTYNKEVDDLVIYAALGVFDNNEQYLGSIITQFEPNKIVRAIQRRIDSPNTHFVITDYDLETVMSSFPIAIEKKTFSSVLKISVLESGEIILPENIKYNNILFSTYIKSSDYPYFIFTGYNPNISQKEFIIASARTFVDVAGGAGVVLLILWLFYKLTIKPINQLSIAADKILDGKRVRKMPRGNSKQVNKFALILLQIQRYIEERNKTVEQLNATREDLLKSNKEKEKAQQALEKEKEKYIDSKRSRERFIGRIKHEIQKPLSSMEGFLQVLLKKEKDNIPIDKKEMVTYLENALKAIDIIKNWTTNSLVISKVSIRPLIQQCIQIQSEETLIEGIDLKSSIPKDIPDIFADDLRLNQIITALIFRAIEDSPDFIKVAVSVSRENKKKYLNIIFKDDGIGYSHEKREQLFEKYNHNTPISRKSNGTDLPLPVIEKLVQLHAGTMDIESKQGKGTTVKVVIPYRSESEANKIPDNGTNKKDKDGNIVYHDFSKK